MSAHKLKRIQLLCGLRDAGKTYLIRRIACDELFGGGEPGAGRVGLRSFRDGKEVLVVRVGSPHERYMTLDKFIYSIVRSIEQASRAASVECSFLGAVHPTAFGEMPGIVEICSALKSKFNPSKFNLVELNPDQQGRNGGGVAVDDINALGKIGVIISSVDASRGQNEQQNIRNLIEFYE